MAFTRKKSFRRWGTRRKISASAIPKSIARVRKQRVVVFNTMVACEYTCVAADPLSCFQEATLSIIRNVDLQALFGDNCKVASIRGSVVVDPFFTPPYSQNLSIYGSAPAWLAWMDFMSRTILQGRAGLIKSYSNSDQPTNPLPDYHIDNSFDWSEAPWMRQWNHLWVMKEDITIHHRPNTAIQGICPNHTQAGYLVPPWATGTSPGYIVPPAVTSCSTIFENGQAGPIADVERHMKAVTPWRIPVNIRRDITLKENENLDLKVSFASLFPGTDCFEGGELDNCEIGNGNAAICTFRIIPNIMVTIQYG